MLRRRVYVSGAFPHHLKWGNATARCPLTWRTPLGNSFGMFVLRNKITRWPPKPTQTFQSYSFRPIVTTTGSWRIMTLTLQPHVYHENKYADLHADTLWKYREKNEGLWQSRPGGKWSWASAGSWTQVGSHQDCSIINSTDSSCLPQPTTKSPSFFWLNPSLSTLFW